MPPIGCAVSDRESMRLLPPFAYSICIDSIVLGLSLYKLLIQTGGHARTRLAGLIFRDGMIYFVIMCAQFTA